MIRGKKLIYNTSILMKYYQDGKMLGEIEVSQTRIQIYVSSKDVWVTGPTLKKHYSEYNQQYLQRKMRSLFLDAYDLHQQEQTFNKHLEQKFRVEKTLAELSHIRAPLGIVETAEEVSKRADELIEMCAPLEGYCWRNL